MDNVPPPFSGLGSNSNYLLFDDCSNLSGVAVTISITSDMVASAGFGFQLNAYSPSGEACIWQQYCIVVDTSGQMACIVDNWHDFTTQVFNNWLPLYRLPSAALTAGYTCTIALKNDSSGRVTGATYTVNAPAPAPGTALTSFVDGYGEHVCCIAASGHIHQLISDRPNWLDQDLTAWARGPQAANGSAVTSFVDSFGEHVCYIGADDHVHKLMTTAGGWQDSDLTAWAHGPQAAHGSALTSFVDGFGEHICYIGADNHVHKLMTAAGGWQDNDLTAMAHGPQAATGNALTSFVDSFGEHVCYIGADGHVHKLITPPGAPWQDNDLTVIAHGPEVATGSALTSFVDSFGEHVCYTATDGYVHQLMTIGGGGWLDGNLTSVTVSQDLLQPLPSADLAPVVAFELDIVGFDDGQSTTFSSASGVITYSATTPMTVINAEPVCCPVGIGTAETANTTYGELPTGSSGTFVQSFAASSTVIRAPRRYAFRLIRPTS